MRVRIRFALVAAAFVLAVQPSARAAPPEKQAFRPSKSDLVASYRPHRLQGVDWYARIGAARAKEMRQRRQEGQERLILQMRLLGPLDGAT